MHVAFDEAGREDLAGGVDDLGVLADELLDVGGRAHGDDLAVLGGHAAVFDDREVGLAFFDLIARDGDGVDLRMLDDQVCLGIPSAHNRFSFSFDTIAEKRKSALPARGSSAAPVGVIVKP